MENEFLDVGISSVRIAQKEILKFYNNEKPENLDIDKFIEEVIKSYILKVFPSHNFDGEETAFTNNNSNYTWYCDPIACSINFYCDIPHFAICLSLFKNENCVLGIVLDPVTNELFYADEKSAYLNDKRLVASNEINLENKFFCCSSKYDYDKLNLIQNEFNMYHKLPGSWGLSFAWTGGRKFIFVFGKLKDIYGTAPGIYIAQKSGCYIKDYEGNDWSKNSKNIIICQNKKIYDKVKNFILR